MESLTCSIDWCDRESGRSEYCAGHRARLKAGRDLNTPWRKKRPDGEWESCSFPGCQNKMWATELCKTHYKQFSAGEQLTQINYRAGNPVCAIAGCSNSAGGGFGMCVRHVQRAGKYGLTAIQLQMLFDSACAICGIRLNEEDCHIDHDHACCPGKKTRGDCIRGALCRGCNHGLGNFRDNTEILLAAIQYLS